MKYRNAISSLPVVGTSLMDDLTIDERIAYRLYYGPLALLDREVGVMLDVSQQRACAIRRRAIKKISDSATGVYCTTVS